MHISTFVTVRFYRQFFVFTFLLLSFASIATAQNGILVGTIVDAQTGETLIGANVLIDGTMTGTSSDLEGRYRLENLEAGFISIVVSYIGFENSRIENVGIVANSVSRLDISLAPESFELDEVTVEARMIRNNEASLLRDRQRSNAVSDAISAEAISRSGSANAADAMEKVTGASVIDGKYVYIRGLGERYSNTQLNGIDLPSSDPDKKAVQFDLFPAALLENIVTLKTFTPDKPGNFSGGLVDLNTRSFPDQLTVTISASSSVNTKTNFASNFLTYRGGATNWRGIDNGSHDLPSLLSSLDVKIPSATRARRDPELATTLDALTKSFDDTMSPISGSAPVSNKYALSVGNLTHLFGRKLGFVSSLSYGRNTSSYDDGRIGRYSFTGSALSPDLLLNDAKSTDEVSWGGIANLTYTLSPLHEVAINTLYSRGAESTARFQIGRWPKELGQNDTSSVFVNRALSYTQRELYSLQTRGKHFLPSLLNTTIEWSISTARTTQDEPDTRFFASTERLLGGRTIYAARASGFSNPSRYFRNLEESSQTYKLDVAVPFHHWSGMKSTLKIGGLVQEADRSFRERIFSYDPNVPFNGNDDEYFAPKNLGIIAVDSVRGRFTFGNVIRESSKKRNNYDGTREILAAYAMIEIPIVSGLKLVSGARVETTNLGVTSQDSTQAVGSLNDVDVLPSANMVVELSDKMNLRAAWTRTLARPTFREIAPFESFDFILSNFRIGNPNLERTRITNYDLRWEWFKRPGEIIAASFFHKRLYNAIEQVIIGGTNGQLQYQNVNLAKITGLELELRTGLDFLSILSAFSFGLNASFVGSSVDIAESELEVRKAIDPNTSSTRRLQGQSPYIINSNLGYTSAGGRTTASVYYNVFGRRLSSVSLGGTPDVYERSSPQLDFSVSQRLLHAWSVKISVRNILDSSSKESYQYEGRDYIYSRFSRGRSFSLSASYKPY